MAKLITLFRRHILFDLGENEGQFQGNILWSLSLLLLLPFGFTLFQLSESDMVRLVLPLILILMGLIYLVFRLVRSGKRKIVAGIVLILPIFISSCLGLADLDFFSRRVIMTTFPKGLSPSLSFPLGTDYEGRDIFSTIVIGGTHAYMVAFISTLVSLLVGIPVGVSLTSKRGVLRGVASVITQFFEIIPQLFFVLIVLGVYNFWSATSAGSRLISAYAIPIAGFAIGVSALPSVARIVENRVTQLQSRRFISALRGSNVSKTKVLWYNIIWKNCLSEILVQATFLFGATILVESALGYAFEIGFGELGTGGYLSWGKILAESRRAILFGEHIWIVLFPIAATVMSILGVNIIGDSLARMSRTRN